MKKLFSILLLAAILAPSVAQAAISFIGSCENSAAVNPNGADVTLDLTTISGLAQNDLVIIAYSIGDNDSVDFDMDASAVLSGAGYTEVADVHAPTDTFDVDIGVYWKVMGATPDTDATVDGQGGTDAAVAAVCMVFRGVDTTTPMDVTPTTDSLNNTMHPDPPSIDHGNPSGVWTVIAGASGHNLSGAGTFTFPTGYTTDAIDRGSDDTSDTTVGLGYRSSGISDPEDPGTMTHAGTDNVAYVWAAATLALRPQSTTAPTITTNADTGVGVSLATLNGEITATGGANATVRGFAWGTSSTLSGGNTATTTNSGSFGTGTWGETVYTLKAGTTYYFRAYATNSAGTGYGAIDAGFTTGTDTSISRTIRLFEGFIIKLFTGRIRLFGQ